MNNGIFIFGSSVTMDVFSFADHKDLVKKFVERQSLVSAVSEPFLVEMDEIHLASKWHRQTVHADLNKTLPALLRETEFDCLLIDLIDERFGLAARGKSIVTSSNFFQQSGFMQTAGFKLVPFSRKHALWRESCERFVEMIAPYLDRRAVILHPAMWAEKYLADGEIRSFGDEDGKIRFANEYLNEYYLTLQQCASPNLIVLPHVDVVADAKHKWGLNPFHYVKEYYDTRLEQIQDAMLQKDNTPPTRSMFPTHSPHADAQARFAACGRAEITAFDQKIDWDHFHCAVAASYPSSATYTYNISLNDAKIDQIIRKTPEPLNYQLILPGYYAVGCTISTAEGETFSRNPTALYFAKAEFDVHCGAETAVQLERIPSMVVRGAVDLGKAARAGDPAVAERFLYADFTRESLAYFSKNNAAVQQLRRDTLCGADSQAPEGEEDGQSVRAPFISAISDLLHTAVVAYGEKNLLLTFPLFDWDAATEEELCINWLIEECRAAARRLKNARILSAPGGLRTEDGKPALSDEYAKRLNRLARAMAEEREAGIGLYRVRADVAGNTLTVGIQGDAQDKDYSYWFYLVRDGAVIDRSKRSGEPTHQWILDRPGIYLVQGYVGHVGTSTYYRSNTVEFFPEEDAAEYRAFLAETAVPENLIGQKLRLFDLQYPFYNFALAFSRGERELDVEGGIEVFVSHNSVYEGRALCAFGDYRGTLVANREHEIRGIGEHKLLFSGVSLANGRFLTGFRDIKMPEDYELLYGALGTFTMLRLDEESCEVSTDYFGMNHIYYYENRGEIMLSNSYHMLLELLTDMGANLTLDEDKACVTLSAVKIQILRQNFSYRMDVREISQRPTHLDLRLSENGAEWVDNAYGRALNKNERYHDEQYRALLKSAKDELLSNLVAVVDDPHYLYVTSDLTGGLDSRLVYGMITSLPAPANRIQIRANPPMSDLELALKLNSMYGLSYTTSPTHSRFGEPDEMEMDDRSYHLGTYANDLLPISPSIVSHNREIALNGACGEIVARPIIARNFMMAPREAELSVGAFVRYVMHGIALNVLVDHDKAFAPFETYMKDTLETIPVDSVYEKIDRHYLDFRNGYHFSPTMLYARGMASWMPIQSKIMLRIHHMTLDLFRSIKLQLDMIFELNPMLMTVPFENARDEQDRLTLEDTLYARDPRYWNWKDAAQGDMDAWEQAKAEKQRNHKSPLTGEESRALSARYQALPETVYESLLYNFRALMKVRPGFDERVGLALFYFIRNNKNNRSGITVMYKKITSILDQVRIIDKGR